MTATNSSSETWKSNLGEWLPLRTRDGAMRVGPDSPDRNNQHSQRNGRGPSESFNGTPRHQPMSVGALSGATLDSANPGSTFLLGGDIPATVPQSSIPFFFPSSNNNNGGGGFFDFLSGQQDDDSSIEDKQINAPYFVPELLDKNNSNNNNNNNNSTSIGSSSSSNNNNKEQQWVAFAPISPDEVQLAVSSIVGAFPAHTITRYSVERTLTSRFNLPKVSEPTVLAVHFFTKTRENALHVLHRHERAALFKGSLGDVKCAVTTAPSYALACGVLNPFAQQAHLRNNHNHVENSVSLQLAQQAGRGNVSVCRKLEISQAKPLKMRLEIWIRKYGRKVLYVLVAMFLIWLFFFP